jgi:hypothetical protein
MSTQRIVRGGYQVSFPGCQESESWSYYLPPSAGIKNEWSYTSTPLICLHVGGRNIFSLPSHSSGWHTLSVYYWFWFNPFRIADTKPLNNTSLCLFTQPSLLAPSVSPRSIPVSKDVTWHLNNLFLIHLFREFSERRATCHRVDIIAAYRSIKLRTLWCSIPRYEKETPCGIKECRSPQDHSL